MKCVLIYDEGEFESYFVCKEFNSEDELIRFVNKEKIGKAIVSAYRFYDKVEIEPYKKVTEYRIKS